METARARDLKDLYLLLLDKGRRPHALARAGRARARARAKSPAKTRMLKFYQGQSSIRSKKKLFSFSNSATVPNLISIRADLEKLWWKWKSNLWKSLKFLKKLDQNLLEFPKSPLPAGVSLCALPICKLKSTPQSVNKQTFEILHRSINLLQKMINKHLKFFIIRYIWPLWITRIYL